MKSIVSTIALALVIGSTALAHIPVTESATQVDANIDGANLAGNYRVLDNCDGGAFQKPRSQGLATIQFATSYENDVAGVKTKHAEFQYSYMRRQTGSDYKVKQGKVVINKLRKVTELKKIDGELVDSKSRLEADSADVSGDLTDDNNDGRQAVKFLEDGRIQFNGKDCDEQVTLTPTKDIAP
ncbi:MAG: hypothetical protein K0R29_1476 [Pseudobdellovibrio sp.]|nr:hypothetical protein [Pseudobdellovibrio sp.]